MKDKNKLLFVLLALIVFGVIYLVVSLTENVGKTATTVDMEKSIKSLNSLYKTIGVRNYNIQKSSAITTDSATAVLPDISEYPFVVNPTTDNFITIYSSTEKANENVNSWLRVIAEEFNKSGATVGGVPVSVGVRSISSGLAADFIISGKYTPDLYIPASDIYGTILSGREIQYTKASDGIVQNYSGIVLSKRAKQNIISKYQNADAQTVINSVINGDSIIGYTNPLSNEDGLNYLLTILSMFDSNPLSTNAQDKLKTYQDKIPYVPYDITQLEDSLQNGSIDGFASNYQTYYSIPDLRNNYEFIPFGMVQNSPAYAIGNLTQMKTSIITEFIKYCQSTEAQTKATNEGFNGLQNYTYSGYKYSGTQVEDAQNMWKKEKNGTNDLTAIFVADISGSMQGSPLLKLKASLNRASTFIDENTNIGLVTFSDTVNIALPVAKFDNAQKAYFTNAVKSMNASGGTAMFDAIVVAEHMLVEQWQKNNNTRLMIFVLTDGESNRGYGFEDIEEVTRGLRIPIYTIGYNADIDVLQEVSDINEATTMDADSDNVIYRLESLFNSQM
ncbi:MAG: VWA domain-containing protein [Clostridia bacterium]|nr:VWA domain-containing protein [Clostridia bacterium]